MYKVMAHGHMLLSYIISLTWGLVSKLLAHHCGISGVPIIRITTHSAPHLIDTHLHSPLIMVCSTNQTNITIAKTLV